MPEHGDSQRNVLKSEALRLMSRAEPRRFLWLLARLLCAAIRLTARRSAWPARAEDAVLCAPGVRGLGRRGETDGRPWGPTCRGPPALPGRTALRARWQQRHQPALTPLAQTSVYKVLHKPTRGCALQTPGPTDVTAGAVREGGLRGPVPERETEAGGVRRSAQDPRVMGLELRGCQIPWTMPLGFVKCRERL